MILQGALKKAILFFDSIEDISVCIVDEGIVKMDAFEQFTHFFFRFEPMRVVDAGYFCFRWCKDNAFYPHIASHDILSGFCDVGSIVYKDSNFITLASLCTVEFSIYEHRCEVFGIFDALYRVRKLSQKSIARSRYSR